MIKEQVCERAAKKHKSSSINSRDLSLTVSSAYTNYTFMTNSGGGRWLSQVLNLGSIWPRINVGGPDTPKTVFKRLIYVHFSRKRVNNSKIVKNYFNHMIYVMYTWNNKASPIMYETWHFSFLSPKMDSVAITHEEQVTSIVSRLK